MATRLGPRLPLRRQAPLGLASEVPAPGRPPGQEDARARRGPREAGLRRATSRSARPRPGCDERSPMRPRARCRDGSHRCDGRRRLRRVPALHRAGSPAEAVDAARLRLDLPQPRSPAPGLRPPRGSHARVRRTMGSARHRSRSPPREPDTREGDHRFPRRHGASAQAVPPAGHPVADVKKPRTAAHTEINVFSPEEIMALVRAADSEQDAAIYLTAAFTGRRQGELVPGNVCRVCITQERGV